MIHRNQLANCDPTDVTLHIGPVLAVLRVGDAMPRFEHLR
jgi:hypothetical protein